MLRNTLTIACCNCNPEFYWVDKILGDGGLQTMPIRYDWGCKTFQNGSHTHLIHIQGVWAPSVVVDKHIWMHPSTLTIANIEPQCCRVDWNLKWRWRRANNANTLYDWGCKTFQTGSHIHFIHIHVHGVWAPSAVVDRHMDATLTIADIHPQCCRVVWKLMSWRRANNATTLYDWGCKSYQTGSHIQVIHIQGVWVPSVVVDWHMNAPTHPCHSRCSSLM